MMYAKNIDSWCEDAKRIPIIVATSRGVARWPGVCEESIIHWMQSIWPLHYYRIFKACIDSYMCFTWTASCFLFSKAFLDHSRDEEGDFFHSTTPRHDSRRNQTIPLSALLIFWVASPTVSWIEGIGGKVLQLLQHHDCILRKLLCIRNWLLHLFRAWMTMKRIRTRT